MKKKVLLRAPLLTNSGYGVHSRQVFEWLESRNDMDLVVQALQWGHTPWIVNPDFENGLFGRIMNCARATEGKFDLTFQVQLPDEWDETLGNINIGVTALVETDKCNVAWYDKIEKMDHVIVPSNFTKDVLLNTFGIKFDHKVHVIPEWFNPHINNKDKKVKLPRGDRYRFDTKFNLLTVGTLTSPSVSSDRKNMACTIGWAIEALEGQKDTGIIVKTCLGKGSVKDREMTKDALDQIVKRFRKSEFPKVYLVHGNMTSLEMASLFNLNSVKGYVSATRGEGYGLPLIEAASAAVPVVATDWSGHLDFLNDNFLKTSYRLIDIPEERIDGRIFIKNTKWAQPDADSYKENIIELRQNYESHLANARKLRKNVVNRFSKEKICKKYDKFIREKCDL